jgi:hypothetical protein
MRKHRRPRKQLETLENAQLATIHGGWDLQVDSEIWVSTDASVESRYNYTNSSVSKISVSTLKV